MTRHTNAGVKPGSHRRGTVLWATRTVAVKYRYNLAVDTTERTALSSALTLGFRRHRRRSPAAGKSHFRAVCPHTVIDDRD